MRSALRYHGQYDISLLFSFYDTGDSLTASKIFRELHDKGEFTSGEENIRYLTAEDLYGLSMEVTENSLSTITSEAEYIPIKESISVAELLFNRLSRYLNY